MTQPLIYKNPLFILSPHPRTKYIQQIEENQLTKLDSFQIKLMYCKTGNILGKTSSQVFSPAIFFAKIWMKVCQLQKNI